MAPELGGAKAAARKVWGPRRSCEIAPGRVKRLRANLKIRRKKKKRAAEVLIMGKTSAELFS